MKYIKKFNESITNIDQVISDLNKLFKWHSYYVWGIEFDLTDFPNENTDLGDSLSKMTYKKDYQPFYDMCLKYKGWKFSNEQSLGTSKHDHDWHEFTIEITDADGDVYIGKGDTCPAEAPRLTSMLDTNEAKKKDFEEYTKLKNKWGFN